MYICTWSDTMCQRQTTFVHYPICYVSNSIQLCMIICDVSTANCYILYDVSMSECICTSFYASQWQFEDKRWQKSLFWHILLGNVQMYIILAHHIRQCTNGVCRWHILLGNVQMYIILAHHIRQCTNAVCRWHILLDNIQMYTHIGTLY